MLPTSTVIAACGSNWQRLCDSKRILVCIMSSSFMLRSGTSVPVIFLPRLAVRPYSEAQMLRSELPNVARLQQHLRVFSAVQVLRIVFSWRRALLQWMCAAETRGRGTQIPSRQKELDCLFVSGLSTW